jgi:hypothetical protein
VAGVIGSLPVATNVQKLHKRVGDASAGEALFQLGRVCVLAVLMVASAMALSAQTHNPFIYFRF